MITQHKLQGMVYPTANLEFDSHCGKGITVHCIIPSASCTRYSFQNIAWLD